MNISTTHQQSDIFNINNNATFSVSEMKKFAENFAILSGGNNTVLTNFCKLCKEMYYDKFVEASALEWWNNLPIVHHVKECKEVLSKVYFSKGQTLLSTNEIIHIWRSECYDMVKDEENDMFFYTLKK